MPSEDLRVAVMLAEYNALRAEIEANGRIQATLIGLALTALGAVVALVVRDDGDEQLLMAIPALALFVNLLNTAATWRIATIGRYIRRWLWPRLNAVAGGVPSWEDEIERHRLKSNATVRVLLLDAPSNLILVVASLIAIGVRWGDSSALLIAGALCVTAAAAAVPGGYALIRRREARQERSRADVEPS